MSGFGDDLKGFAQRTGIRFDKVVRKVVIDLTRDIILATPVDTGMARSNWFWGVSRITTVQGMDGASKNGSPSIMRSMEFASDLKAGGVFYITNNLPYIMRLEYGSSTQAPTGMARDAVARWQPIVNAAVRSVL